MKALDFTPLNEVMVAGARFHHHAFRRGYHPVSAGVTKETYEGRFGRGYIVAFPSTRVGIGRKMSNRYHVIEYYIFDK